MTTDTGKVIGFWFPNPADARNSGFVDAMIARFDLWHWFGADRRLVTNTVDDRGGMFVMFADHPAPGETSVPPAASSVPPNDDRSLPANTLHAGMTRRQVRRALGRPTNSITQKQFEGQYRSVVRLGSRRRRGSEAWMYVDVPSVGLTTMIMFEHGRVTTVQTSRDRP